MLQECINQTDYMTKQQSYRNPLYKHCLHELNDVVHDWKHVGHPFVIHIQKAAANISGDKGLRYALEQVKEANEALLKKR
jgi:hypothetical protein